jgi:hypothetical protein
MADKSELVLILMELAQRLAEGEITEEQYQEATSKLSELADKGSEKKIGVEKKSLYPPSIRRKNLLLKRHIK